MSELQMRGDSILLGRYGTSLSLEVSKTIVVQFQVKTYLILSNIVIFHIHKR